MKLLIVASASVSGWKVLPAWAYQTEDDVKDVDSECHKCQWLAHYWEQRNRTKAKDLDELVENSCTAENLRVFDIESWLTLPQSLRWGSI